MYKFLALISCLFVSTVQGVAIEDMTLEEKIGQLFILPACQLRGEDHLKDMETIIQKYHIGGVILKQGTAQGQRRLIETLQGYSALPLLCVQDGENGVAMRLSDVVAFPRNLTLGAVQDRHLLFQLGQEIGRQCLLVGTHLNLVPVADVNSNPKNPIIHMRSFGEDPHAVALCCELIMRGIQSMGVLACAKHFPGHGDTAVDSHIDLPFVSHDKKRLYAVELFPFQALIYAGVDALMTAHLLVPAFEEQGLLPVTFSRQIVTELLQKQMGFDGLIISDALNMQAVAKHYTPEQIALNAFRAGHDLLLYGDHIAPRVDQILHVDFPKAFFALKAAVEAGEISEEDLDAKVAKILEKKKGLAKAPDWEEINSASSYALKRKLFEEAVTLGSRGKFTPLAEGKIAVIEWGKAPCFLAALEKEHDVDVYALLDPLLAQKLQGYDHLILSLAQYGIQPPHFGMGEKEESALRALAQLPIPSVAVVFGTPYSLLKLPPFETVLIAYEREAEAQEAAAAVLLGKLSPKGRLPIHLNEDCPFASWR